MEVLMVDGQMEKEQLSVSLSDALAEGDRQSAFNWLHCCMLRCIHTESTVLGDECVACLNPCLVLTLCIECLIHIYGVLNID